MTAAQFLMVQRHADYGALSSARPCQGLVGVMLISCVCVQKCQRGAHQQRDKVEHPRSQSSHQRHLIRPCGSFSFQMRMRQRPSSPCPDGPRHRRKRAQPHLTQRPLLQMVICWRHHLQQPSRLQANPSRSQYHQVRVRVRARVKTLMLL